MTKPSPMPPPMIESQDKPCTLTRDMLPELLKTIAQEQHATTATWNAVDALELLIEAGQFRAARSLAISVCKIVETTPRHRLFKGYAALCELMEEGTITHNVGTIEALYVEIHHAGHSDADKVRAAMLLARALFVGVALGVLHDSELIRARTTLLAELDRCSANSSELQAQVGLELAKTYMYAPQPELLPAQLILEKIERELSCQQRGSELAFEILRARYHVERAGTDRSITTVSPEMLRAQAVPLGAVARGVAELSIARMLKTNSYEAQLIEGACLLFEENEYLSGMLEGFLLLAQAAAAQRYNSRAMTYFTKALTQAERGGLLQGVLLAKLGALQSALTLGELKKAQEFGVALEDALRSEMAVGLIGTSVVSAAQIMGDSAAATRSAKRCEAFFRTRGLKMAQAQAGYMLGSCYAAIGDWKKAQKICATSVAIEDERRAYISASEKRAALVQALAMAEFTERGYISKKKLQQVHRILYEAELALEPFGNAPQALKTKAKLFSTLAQLCVIAKDPVEAVRHLNSARKLYEELDSKLDVALTDAVTGLALLEVGKTRSGEIFEEAHRTLQIAHEFFDKPQYNPIRWKLKYYLSISAYLSSQAKGHGASGHSWRAAAADWLRGAVNDVGELNMVQGSSQDSAEFSPGLKPEVLEPLKRALGVKVKSRSRGSNQGDFAFGSPGDGGYLH